MSNEVETSRCQTERCFHGILRLRYAPVRMTTKSYAAMLFAFTCVYAAAAQESETPVASPLPAESAVASPAPSQTPSPAPARKVRISFVPPPLEGTISLGVYDETGKLVRVLHRQADFSEFTIGADALVTQWDGKDNDGQDLPAGRYRAHGYLVGSLKLEDLSDTSSPPVQDDANAKIKVRLVRNPLHKDKRPSIELGVGFDKQGTYLKTGDDLPLFTVSKAPNVSRAWITAKAQDAMDVWQDDGVGLHQLRVSNLDQMMAFDCGEFELK